MLVIARNYGQLGNRLFLYSHLIAAAREHNVLLSNVCFAEYAEFFTGTCGDLWCRYPKQPGTRAPRRITRNITAKVVSRSVRLLAKINRLLGRFGIVPSLAKVVQLQGTSQHVDLNSAGIREELQHFRYWFAQGWLFRSERLFEKHQAAIREHFRLIPPHAEVVNREIARLRQESDVVVGIHVRAGDYATWDNGKYYYSPEDYANVMRGIANQVPDRRVTFLVCSNSHLNHADFSGLNVHFGPGHLVQDMYLLAETDLIVGPPSTYSGWASFYRNVPLAVLETSTTPVSFAKLCPHLTSQSHQAA